MTPPIGKRIFDLLASSVLLAVLAPLLAAVAALQLAAMGRPVLFRQLRPGLDGRLFRIYKFRTMKEDLGPDGKRLSDGERLSPLGRWMRRWSIDELPELFNVLGGDMSLVGPRPLLPQYMERYTPRQARRHEVMPGITGWAQINGRNAITWEEKFDLDVWYVDHRSFRLDLNILLLTVWKVMRREGIHQEGSATMAEFMGSDRRNPGERNA